MFTTQEISQLIEQAKEIALEKFKNNLYEEAELVLEYSLKVQPENIEILQLMGLTQYRLGKFDCAIKFFENALKNDAKNTENYSNIALCYSSTGKYQKAISYLEKAIQLNPEHSYLYSNIGLQYRNIGNLEKAIECFKKSNSICEKETTWAMMGGCFGERKQLKEAEECLKKSIEIKPDFAAAHVDLASVYHLQGKWDQAWKEYEWRTEVYDQLKFWNNILDPEKKWKQECLDGKIILIHEEQGSGDTINFFRYISLVKKLGAHIILCCNSSLEKLFKNQVDEIFIVDASTKKMPEHDYHCSVLSLPYLLDNPIIPDCPYLFANKTNMDDYKGFYKIGIAWAGNPQHSNDFYRSCKLSNFKNIHDIPKVKLFSLVKDTRPRAYRFNPDPVDLTENCENMKIVDMRERMENYQDTAEIINYLDLIITVDTSILHLAGALNKATYGLLPYNADWRWELEGEKTVWYPSVRLFRQKSSRDWNSVFSEVEKLIK
jgi:tetratricopeptide (TPR) repeat protein